MKKSILGVFIVFAVIFMNIFVTATEIEPVLTGNNVTLYQTCNNCTFCNLTIAKNPLDEILLTNQAFDENDTYYSKKLLGGNTTDVGIYTYCYNCGNEEQSETGCINFEVTNTGNKLTGYQSAVHIILIFFFIFLMAGFYITTHKINFPKWYDRIIEKYQTRNFVKLVFAGIVYGLMKNSGWKIKNILP